MRLKNVNLYKKFLLTIKQKDYFNDLYKWFEENIPSDLLDTIERYKPHSEQEYYSLLASEEKYGIQIEDFDQSDIWISKTVYLHYLFVQELISLNLGESSIVEYSRKFLELGNGVDIDKKSILAFYILNCLGGQKVNLYLINNNVLIAYPMEYELMKKEFDVNESEVVINLNLLLSYLFNQDLPINDVYPLLLDKEYVNILNAIVIDDSLNDLKINQVNIDYKNNKAKNIKIVGSAHKGVNYELLRNFIGGYGKLSSIYHQVLRGYEFTKNINLQKKKKININ